MTIPSITNYTRLVLATRREDLNIAVFSSKGMFGFEISLRPYMRPIVTSKPGFESITAASAYAEELIAWCEKSVTETSTSHKPHHQELPMIKPTIGRIVWYWTTKPISPAEQPMAAIVTYVHSDLMVNLTVFDYDGNPSGFAFVPLVQAEGEKPVVGNFCEWMPYQLGQAAKAQAAEAQLENIISGAPVAETL